MDTDASARCPECGLEFSWRDLFAARPTPPWALEPRGRLSWTDLARRPFSTLARAIVPGAPWEPTPTDEADARPRTPRLAMSHPITLGGLVRAAAMGFLASWILAAAISTLLAIPLAGVTNQNRAIIAVTNAAQSGWAAPNVTPWHAESLALGAWHWYRVPILAPGVAWTADSADTVRSMVLSFWPLGTIILMPATFLLLPQTLARRHVRHRHLWRLAAYAVIPLPILGVWMAFPSYLHALSYASISLRAAAWRADTLGLPGHEWARHDADSRLSRLIDTLDLVVQRVIRPDGGSLGVILVGVISLLWLWFWWHRAASRYLRLPHAAFDTFLLLVVGLLSTPIAALLVGAMFRVVT
jgi:hypothetical protein